MLHSNLVRPLLRRVATALITLLSTPAFCQDEVLFSKLFTQGGLGSSVVIQVPENQTLVFDAGTYQLDRRDLLVFASRAIVRGIFIVRSFSPNGTSVLPPTAIPPTPPTSPVVQGVGTQGSIGVTGPTGNSAPRFLLDIASLSVEPSASLTVDCAGEMGGQGGTGGQGGKGGTGRRGRDAGGFPCSRPCPDSGSKGGPGGPKGAGGQGGQGGNGGKVYLSAPLVAMLGSAGLSVTVQGGPGGRPGQTGNPGVGGDGGPRGSGSSSCVCSDPPPPGPIGDAGGEPVETTPSSLRGNEGSIQPLPQR